MTFDGLPLTSELLLNAIFSKCAESKIASDLETGLFSSLKINPMLVVKITSLAKVALPYLKLSEELSDYSSDSDSFFCYSIYRKLRDDSPSCL